MIEFLPTTAYILVVNLLEKCLFVRFETEVAPVQPPQNKALARELEQQRDVFIFQCSIGCRVSEALFFGSLFLPGAIFAKYAFSKITKEDKAGFVRDAAFISIGIIIGEVFLFMISAYIIIIMRHSYDFPDWPDLPSALQNPVFISVIISFLAVGSKFLDRWLEKKFPSGPKKITFLSDRRSVTLLTSEILYVESNDTITILHAAGGSSLKNRTPISQWESILDTEFVRIHRSFLVNRSAITAVDKDALYIGDVELPVSRKYKESVSRLS